MRRKPGTGLDMIIPPHLKPGDRVGIVAPARKISEKELLPALKVFGEWGLEVVPGKHLFGQKHQFSGSDAERTADLQNMLDDNDIRAIFCARGGYGSVRIIDQLDFSAFTKHPKWIVGFSDITVLHSHIQQNFGICTLHALMPLNIVKGKKMETRQQALLSLQSALFGRYPTYKIPAHPLNCQGQASGILCGGNLSILYSINGSHSDINTRDKILFIEDLDEYLYHIDRMMACMKRAHKLDGIRGLIVGGMTAMRDNKVAFGQDAEHIVADWTASSPYPVCFGFPAGHIDDNRALILGKRIMLNVEKDHATIKF